MTDLSNFLKNLSKEDIKNLYENYDALQEFSVVEFPAGYIDVKRGVLTTTVILSHQCCQDIYEHHQKGDLEQFIAENIPKEYSEHAPLIFTLVNPRAEEIYQKDKGNGVKFDVSNVDILKVKLGKKDPRDVKIDIKTV